MYINRIVLYVLLSFPVSLLAYANDSAVDSNKTSVSPTQKNSSVVNNAAKDDSTSNPEQFPSLSQADVKKAPSKDTSLNLTGNGGSTNRGAGGNAMLRKRFTF